MKVNRIKLQEILWETTLDCNKNCTYCGSKDILNKDENVSVINIANEIIKYPPKRITLTGGEPALLKELPEVIEILSKNNISVNILTNGLLYNKLPHNIEFIDRIGYSVNTLEDIKVVANNLDKISTTHIESVMITNFGTHNIWEFDKLAKCYADNNFVNWQVQLTMGEQQLTADGIQHLYNNFDAGYSFGDLLVDFQNVVFADNLQKHHECNAGMNSLSILQNGDIVRCLSARAYEKKLEIYGNLNSEFDISNSKSKLQHIFECDMNSCRFCSELKCCRDLIDYPKNEKIFIDKLELDKQNTTEIDDWINKTGLKMPSVEMYGINDYDGSFVYGVTSGYYKN